VAPSKKIDTAEIMVVNDTPGEECRIAILADGHLDELYSERLSTATQVGNIYKGRVTNVEPAIQAAFIDYGQGQNGFLHISDLHPRYFPGQGRTERVGKKIPRRERPAMQNALKRGDEVLVQVLKQGIGTKGPTLTSYLSIPGRLLVMMPDMDRVGVSRKVEDEEKRREMRKVLDQLDLPKGFGFILRTAGFGQTKTELKRDAAYLQRLWKAMDKRIQTVKAPCELYTESDLLIRTVRDVLRPSIQAILVDSESAHRRALTFLNVVAPRSAPKLIRYTRRTPIFHAFDIERQIELIHSREVPLPSGGKLVIEQTEALVAIDVNSGKSRAARDAETNAYQTNCEAVDEIARQLRLRDLGGLIIHDLIDMRAGKNRRAIEERFQQNLKRDRARSTILRISEFGLVEMTRQRMRPSMRKSHFVDCPHCQGHGEIKSPESVGGDAVRHAGYLLQFDRVQRVEIACSTRVATVLLSAKRRELVRLEDAAGKRIDVRVSDALAPDRVDFYAYDDRNADIDIAQLPPPRAPAVAELEAESRMVERGGQSPAKTPVEPADEAVATADGEATKSKRKRRRRKKRPADAPAAAAGADLATELARVAADVPIYTAPMRIHVLAKEIGVPARDVMERLREDLGVEVKNHFASVGPEDAASVHRLINTDGEAAPAPASPPPQEHAKPRRRRRGGKARAKHQSQTVADTLPSNDQTAPATASVSAGPVTKPSRRSKRRKRGRQPAENAAQQNGQPEPVETPSPAPSKDAMLDAPTDVGKPARRKKKKKKIASATVLTNVGSMPEHASQNKNEEPATSVQQSRTREEPAQAVAAPDQQKPKPRRRLYRNRGRVSSTARQAAEAVGRGGDE
jgi:Rne/Rng family ribonuclease